MKFLTTLIAFVSYIIGFVIIVLLDIEGLMGLWLFVPDLSLIGLLPSGIISIVLSLGSFFAFK